MKVLKVVAIVAIAAALVVFAAPIAGALTTFGASVFGASFAIAASTIVGIGLTLGLTAVATLFRKGATLSTSMADRLSAQINPAAPRKIVLGRTAAANDTRFVEVYGSKKDRSVRVDALASHRVNGITQWYLEDKLTWQNGSLVAHQDGITSFRAVTEGRPGNGVPIGSGTLWTASSTFTGCAYVAIDFKLDQKAWPQNIPSKVTTIVEGCPVYDPRQDGSRGGAGAHRSNNQDTWTWRAPNGAEIGRNPALCLLAYMLGWRINGRLAWGMGLPIEAIDLANFRLYANVCEEQVQTAAGGTIQRYTCDAIFSTADSHETVISAITAGMGSTKLTDIGGTYSLVGGFDDTLGPKLHFDENDLAAAPGVPVPYSWVVTGPGRETYNSISGKFANPEELYQLQEWGTVESATLADGIPRPFNLDLGVVSRAETCQRIAKQFLAREALTPGFFTGRFKAKAFLVQVGSLLTLSIPAQGFNRKLFRVMEQTEAPDMTYQMTLREESPEVYAWDKNEAKPLPASLRPAGYDASMKIPVAGVRLESRTYQGVD